MFEVYYYGKEDADNPNVANTLILNGKEKGALEYTLNDNLRIGLKNAFNQWAELLGPGAKNQKPVQYFVGTINLVNAFAVGASFSKDYLGFDNNPNHLQDALQNGAVIEWLPGIEALESDPDGDYGFGLINIGKHMGIDKGDGQYGWTAETPSQVPQKMGQLDITAINGDIINDWKNFDENADYMPYSETYTAEESTRPNIDYKNTIYNGGLIIQYDGKLIPYKKYAPGLATNLNFNADMNYGGNIKGSDNMKMNVNSGVLNFSGKADVVNVNVAKDAGVFGETYTVNDMSSRMAEGYSDDSTGKFINHGVIGAASNDTDMTIKGNLVSDGVLNFYGGGSKGNISVSGAADDFACLAEYRRRSRYFRPFECVEFQVAG